MRRGEVIGEVWATRRTPPLDGRRMVIVRETNGRLLVALDTLDVRRGQDVLVSMGSGARIAVAGGADDPKLVCDAAVGLLVDGEDDADR